MTKSRDMESRSCHDAGDSESHWLDVLKQMISSGETT